MNQNTSIGLMPLFVAFLLTCSLFSFSQTTYYTRGAGGDWSNVATWSTASCNGAIAASIPTAIDNVIICNSNGGGGVTVTVDGNFIINNLTIGNANNDCIVQIISAGNSLSINGALSMNTGTFGRNYTLNAGPGIVNVNGTFSWPSAGDNFVRVSTGTINFIPAVTISNNDVYILFDDVGSIYFNAGFSCDRDAVNFFTFPNCNVYFGGTYSQTGTNITWDPLSNAIFQCVGCNIDNTVRLDLGNVIIDDNAVVGTAGGGNLNIYTNLTLNTNSIFTTSKNIPGNVGVASSIGNVTLLPGSVFNLAGAGTYIQIEGNWINNGGTLNGGTYTVRFEGIGNSIGGTASTTFPDLQIGNTLNNVQYTLSQNITCSNLIFDMDNGSRVLMHDGSNPSLAVTGNVTLNQPSINTRTNLWDIAGGSSTIGGNLIFAGTNNTIDRVCKVNVSNGTLSLNGNVTWMTGQGAPQEIATEVISLGSGTINFANSLTMGQGSGTFNVTGPGTVNFNGATAPCFNLNSTVAGNTINAIFSNSFGSTLYFNNGFTNANTAVILADGSTAVFNGNGTVSPTSAITFGNVQINAGVTVTLTGNISVQNNWTNLGGTFTPVANTVTFNGTSAQTITKAAGETFYNLTSNATGPITIASAVTVTNLLTMTAGNYNLNGNTLTLGNAAASTLLRTAGIMYGGIFSRWWLAATAVTGTSGNYYGLFPVGSSSDYRPVAINSTANPTGAGYISVSHIDAIGATDGVWAANDGLGNTIQRMHDMNSAITNAGVTGGTYNLDVNFTALSSVGTLTDMRLMPYLAVGVALHAAATGVVNTPTVKRTALTIAQLPRTWAIGTINKDPVIGTPLRQPYYSRKNGNWNDATVGDATWSFTSGGAGPSCDCIPTNGALVTISPAQIVTLNVVAAPDYLIIETGSSLIGTGNLSVGYDIRVNGNGNFAPTGGTWSVTRDVDFYGASLSSTSPSAVMTITGNLTMAAGSSLTLNQNLTVTGNLILNGTIFGGTRTITLNGTAGKTISGTGTVNLTTGLVSITTGNKTIVAGSNITIISGTETTNAVTITGAITLTNAGTVNVTGNITGSVAGSTWTNAAGSILNITGGLLTTGTLNASASPNTLNYNGSVAQTIKTPATNTYYNLTAANAGIKTVGAALTISNMITIQDAATFTDATFAITGAGGLTMTGTSIYEIRNNTNPVPSLSGTYNLTAGTIWFNRGGNQTVRSLNVAPSAYFNVDFSGTNTKALAGPITVQNNLTISGTSRLDVSATNYAINLKGNWAVTSTNANPFLERNGTVSLTGIVQQSISTVLATGETFYNLIINNSTPAQAIQLSSPTAVSNNINLTDGHVLTTATNLLTMGVGAGITLGATPQDSSFVKGPMAHTVDVSTAVTKIFPVGKDNDYRRADVAIQQGNNTTTLYTTEMIQSSAVALGYTLPVTLDRVSQLRYHTITQNPNTTPITSARVSLFFNCTQKNDFVQDLPNLAVAQWNNTTAWIDRGSSSTGGALCDGVNMSGFITSNAFTTFTGNKFTLANKTGGTNPLPIELLYFDAKSDENSVHVKWETASEQNSDYFMVQRSKNGNDFEDLMKVKAAGFSTGINKYSSVDYTPFEGISYYRLKQVDFDGKFEFSNIVSVEFKNKKEMCVYPNPSQGKFNVRVNVAEGDRVLLVVRDIMGNEHYSKVVILQSSDNGIIAVDLEGRLTPGIYLVIASSNDVIYEKKIIIK